MSKKPVSNRSNVVYWAHLPEHNDVMREGYIGITNNLEARKRRHLRHAAKQQEEGSVAATIFGEAICEHGADNIVWEILHDGLSRAQAFRHEKRYRPHRLIGWNLEPGGEFDPSYPILREWFKKAWRADRKVFAEQVFAGFVDAAKAGDAHAQCYLGDIYADRCTFGIGYRAKVSQDYAKGADWYKRAAEQGQADAQFALGGMYLDGKGVPKDPAKTLEWLRRAAKQGHAESVYTIARMYAKGVVVRKNRAAALRRYRLLAEQEHAAAQWQLGYMFASGNGAQRDLAEAAKWLCRAAEHCHCIRTRRIEDSWVRYARNMGDAKVATWQHAAEQGNADVQTVFGDMYKSGNGVREDEVEAVRWWGRAAEQGHAYAQYRLFRSIELDENKRAKYHHYTTLPSIEVCEKASALLTEVAERGDASAQYLLGICHVLGNLGVPKDDAESARWYRLAAEQGHADAQHDLSIYYAVGRGVPRDDAEAMKWLLCAVERGSASAKYTLGHWYFNGKRVPCDHAEAVRWWKRAGEQGNEYAQNKVGLFYARGAGVRQNYAEAARWFRLAIEQGRRTKCRDNLMILYASGKMMAKSE